MFLCDCKCGQVLQAELSELKQRRQELREVALCLGWVGVWCFQFELRPCTLLGLCQAFKANKSHMKAAQKRKAKLVKVQFVVLIQKKAPCICFLSYVKYWPHIPTVFQDVDKIIPNTLYLWSLLQAARQLSVSDLQSLLGSMTAERPEWVKCEWDAAAFATTAKQVPHGSQVSSVANRLSQSYVSNQPWKQPAWHEVMRRVASVCWGNIVVWSLLGSLVTERTEWLRRKLSTTCLPSFSNFRESFQELCFNPPFRDDQRDVKPCKA